jgi:hypothetical protein
MKTSQKSVFNPYETHILSRLNFFGAVHNFFEVLKKIEFQLKTQNGQPSVLLKNVTSR